MTHWTERSVDDFLHRIAMDFAIQLENRIQSEPLSKAKLAEKLGVSKSRVSQILNNPGNLTLRMIIKCARALGLKVAIIAYDDNDEKNERGPVNSEIFRICWENAGKPLDFWALKKPTIIATTPKSISNWISQYDRATLIVGGEKSKSHGGAENYAVITSCQKSQTIMSMNL